MRFIDPRLARGQSARDLITRVPPAESWSGEGALEEHRFMLTISESRSDATVRASEVGSDLVLLSWLGEDAQAGADPERAYRAIARSLSDHECVPVQERVFCDLTAAGSVAAGRARALAAAGEKWPVPATFVEGSPLGRSGVSGIHVIGAQGRALTVAEGEKVFGTVVETATTRVLGLSDVGRRAAGRLGAGPAEEAGAAIDSAELLLAREGFSFRDVARTWFYLRDILDWYGPFNAVRNAAFQRMGLLGSNGNGKIPASTGIEGRNARGGWSTLDLLAFAPRDGHRLEIRRLHNARQNEATEYGSAFARATEVVVGDARYVFVSGTASIDDRGESVHQGDFETQTVYTLEAVQALLQGTGASLTDVQQATAFIKNPGDGRTFERIVARSGLSELPLVTTVADVCRDELLFEIDATAVLPAREGRR
jgi:enamine deaminase RidA (YjgF/YER057c/UK114 family)